MHSSGSYSRSHPAENEQETAGNYSSEQAVGVLFRQHAITCARALAALFQDRRGHRPEPRQSARQTDRTQNRQHPATTRPQPGTGTWRDRIAESAGTLNKKGAALIQVLRLLLYVKPIWCGRRDSNSYSLRRWNLNPVCLPIPPRPRVKPLKQRRQMINLASLFEYGVDDGDRTHDNRSHNPVLYQLSYAHHIALLVPKLPNGAPGRTRTCDHPLRRRMLYPAELRAPY